MNKVLLVSPHFDDAILSAGQFMAGRPDCDVVTVFGGFPENPTDIHTPYDRKCGFDNAENAIVARRIEDNEATALLKARSMHLGFADSQYEEEKIKPKQIVDAIKLVMQQEDYEYVMCPLGLAHPDHIQVSNALIAAKLNKPLYLWEDLPIRVLEPNLVQKRINDIHSTFGVFINYDAKAEIGTGPIADKIRALLCYKSQIGTGILDPYLMYVPERFYKI